MPSHTPVTGNKPTEREMKAQQILKLAELPTFRA